jgi:alpha-glucosidase
VGYAYWSHDIGGHMPGAIDPELYLRWIEWGIFSPILRTHTTKNPDAERRIWAYPEPYSDLMRDCFARRYAMQPYIYTEARKTYDTGLAFLHPLYYDWPEAPEAYSAKNEYMFGDSILADPITQPVARASRLATTSVWLPPGDWIEWDSGAIFHGPVTVQRSFSLGQIPLYVKAGSIIPMQPATTHTSEKPIDPLILTVFPLKDGQTSKYRIYQDSGDRADYQNGEAAWTPIAASLNEDGTLLNVTISPIQGSYKGMQSDRDYEIRLPGSWPPSSVSVNGESLAYGTRKGYPSWRFDGNTLTTIVSTSRFRVGEAVTITVRTDLENARNFPLLDGFAGKMKRLRESYEVLNANWPAAWSPDPLVSAMQTGDRIAYYPNRAFAELTALDQKIAALAGVIEAMRANGSSAEFTKMGSHLDSNQSKTRLAEYNTAIDIAMAHIADISESKPRVSLDKPSGEQSKMPER